MFASLMSAGHQQVFEKSEWKINPDRILFNFISFYYNKAMVGV